MNLGPALQPVVREVVGGIGEAAAGTACAWCLPVVVVTVPGDLDDLLDLALKAVEGGIGKALADTLGERGPRQLHARHALADLHLGHGHLGVTS